MAFQLVDDILGITGDPAAPASRPRPTCGRGKRSAPIVAALTSGTSAGRRLRDLFADGPRSPRTTSRWPTKLIEEAGGIDWAADEADRRLDRPGPPRLPRLGPAAASDLIALARYVVERDR